MATGIWKAARLPHILKLPTRSIRNERRIAVRYSDQCNLFWGVADCSQQTDSRNRLSKFWAPTGGISPQDRKQGRFRMQSKLNTDLHSFR